MPTDALPVDARPLSSTVPSSPTPAEPDGPAHRPARSSSSHVETTAEAGPSSTQADAREGSASGTSLETVVDYPAEPARASAEDRTAEPRYEPTGLFVANLPQTTPDVVLRQALHFHFSRFGIVKEVKVRHEKDVRPVAPRKQQGDTWAWVTMQSPAQATTALVQAQGIRVLGRTLRVERARAHRVVLLEPRDGVAFVPVPANGWRLRTSEGDEQELTHVLEKHGSILSLEERRNGGGVLVKFNGNDGPAMLKRLEDHPHFHASLYNEMPVGPPPAAPRLPTITLPTRPADPVESTSLERGRSRTRGAHRLQPQLGRAGDVGEEKLPSLAPTSRGTSGPAPDPSDASHADAPPARTPTPDSFPPSLRAPALRLVIPGSSTAAAPALPHHPALDPNSPRSSATVHNPLVGDQQGLVDEKAIFVGGLNKVAVDRDVLGERFGPYGEIIDLHLVRDAPHSSTAFAFITFADAPSAQRAVEGENGTVFYGQALRVQLREAKPRLSTHLRRISPVRGLPDFIDSVHGLQHRSSSLPHAPPVPSGPHALGRPSPPTLNSGYRFPTPPVLGTPGRFQVAQNLTAASWSPAAPDPRERYSGSGGWAGVSDLQPPSPTHAFATQESLGWTSVPEYQRPPARYAPQHSLAPYVQSQDPSTAPSWAPAAPVDHGVPVQSFEALSLAPNGGGDAPFVPPPPWQTVYFHPYVGQPPPGPPGGFYIPMYAPPPPASHAGQQNTVGFPSPPETVTSQDGFFIPPPPTPPFHQPPSARPPHAGFWPSPGAPSPRFHLTPNAPAFQQHPPDRPSAYPSPAQHAGYPSQRFEPSPAPQQRQSLEHPAEGEHTHASTFPVPMSRPTYHHHSSRSH